MPASTRTRGNTRGRRSSSHPGGRPCSPSTFCGRGKSEDDRFCVEDIADHVADMRGLIDIARERHPGLPVYLLGHSDGGVVSCTYALDHQDEIDGPICESFAFQVPARGFVLSNQIAEAAGQASSHG